MYKFHPGSVTVEEEKRIQGGNTATLPLSKQAERTEHFPAFLGAPSARTQKVSAFPLPGSSITAPSSRVPPPYIPTP